MENPVFTKEASLNFSGHKATLALYILAITVVPHSFVKLCLSHQVRDVWYGCRSASSCFFMEKKNGGNPEISCVQENFCKEIAFHTWDLPPAQTGITPIK